MNKPKHHDILSFHNKQDITMNTMNYRGYAAKIEYSDEDDCFVGHIAGISDVIGFHADSVSELHIAFEEAVDDYIQTCKKLGKFPQNPS